MDQRLAHPYLKELHDPKIEFKCPVPWDHAFEDELLEQHLTKPSLQEFMWDEIYKFRPYLKGVHGKGRKQSSAGDADVQMKINNLSIQ